MTTSPAQDAAPSRRKFKYTQQLVTMALDEMTQDEVAKLCRVSQSIVSGWLHGRSRAYEHQVAELRKRYGHRLHRATSRVYLAIERAPEGRPGEPPEIDWEPYRVRRWVEPGQVFTLPAGEDAEPVATTGPVERSAREWAANALRVVQVEGPVTLRHVLSRPVGADRRTGRPVREATGRWIVHHVARERFVLVRQRRRHHHGPEADLWERATRQGSQPGVRHAPVEAGDDAARWLSLVVGPCSASELLAYADDAAVSEAGMLGASLLPFLVRKMLLELGYPVDGVERIGPTE